MGDSPRALAVRLGARDSQRAKAYAWEKALREAEPQRVRALSLEEVRRWVAEVWEDYRGPLSEPPEIQDGRGRKRGRGSRWAIALPVWTRTPLYVLHEVAHALGPEGAAHGPAFVRLCLELWERYARVPRAESLAQARQIGLKVGAAAGCPRPLSRQERRLMSRVAAAALAVKEAESRRQSALRELKDYQHSRRT